MPAARPSLDLIAELLTARLGGWRSQLVLRVMGFASLTWLIPRANVGWSNIASFPPAELAMNAAYIAMLLAGANLGLAAVAAASAAWLIVVGMEIPIFHVAERLVMIAIPLYAVLAHLVHRLRDPALDPATLAARVDRSFVAHLRVTVLVAMSFVAVHKMNVDFLDPELSCMNHVTGRLALWGPLGELAAEWTTPWAVIVGEGAVAVLLYVAPRWGVLWATLLMAVLRLAGFGPIAILISGLAFSFWKPQDLAVLRREARLGIGLFAATGVGYALVAVASPYSGHLTALEIGLYAPFLAAAVAASLVVLLRGGRFAERGFLRPGRFQWPADRASRAMLGVFATFSLAACISPYLGTSFEYSFAMFSNLRADGDRWNHLFFPRWMQIYEHPRIRVVRLQGQPPRPDDPDPHPLEGMLFERTALFLAIQEAAEQTPSDRSWLLEIEYAGERHRFEDVFRNRKLRHFLLRQPADSVLFRPELSGTAPQPCVH